MLLLKIAIFLAFVGATIHIHLRGKVRLGFWRQLSDHSTFMAPINCFMYLFSRVPSTPYIPVEQFTELKALQDNWQAIRVEGEKLYGSGDIKASDTYNDAGFNSFFKTGWKRFYLKWYDEAHPSAATLCPVTTALLKDIPSVKAAMFAALPPGATLVRHRDPFAGSLRYHLGLTTPNDDRCFIDVDGQPYSWRDGEAVMFDETYLHFAENRTDQNRIILFCDIERPLRFAPARWANRFISRNLIAAAAAPNQEGDRTGGINKAFAYVQQVRLWGKRVKARSHFQYYALKWAFFGGLFTLFWLI
ncbi:lipid A hydroxylase LpxO [Chitinimonas sp. BJB300]|uniref:lipid A hydroxylase LpxO n=1 Tax=Chitinimonas sp. BJB300 TaxID=1559339 RepID=UPI000C0D1B3B|nr:lipid A hydroxylase LpxO [Chitinimonas sp. BJB300]PHV12653.1 lipid A hydroxylase LpxO [Chitinimonas sp. BJB300]TSJ91187.1 lipid A hydroxylase LpxO [Chitinimonas sp. BJB300]